MTIEVVWLQELDYSARVDRLFIETIMQGRDRVFEGFEVTERGSGANNSVDVSPGTAIVIGDDIPNQGAYYVRSTAVENVAVTAAPGTGTRTDLITLRVRDSVAIGGADDDAIIESNTGEDVGDLGLTELALATILRTNGDAAVIDANITDQRPLGGWPYTIASSAPSPGGPGVDGDLWVVI